MINIGGHDYTMDEVEQVFQMANELIKANETLNEQLIACMAKLSNEEKKVAGLKLQLFQLTGEKYDTVDRTSWTDEWS